MNWRRGCLTKGIRSIHIYIHNVAILQKNEECSEKYTRTTVWCVAEQLFGKEISTDQTSHQQKSETEMGL